MPTADELFLKIVENNLKREAVIFSAHACPSVKGARKFPQREKTPDKISIRPAFFRDTDRIIHSHSYSRYIDKTQVFYLFENDHITHRVLHVQLVSKIARVIGRSLSLNEDLIEAIALGHDLGHSPYGHDGEAVLNELAIEHKIGSFCHNAQSVRFLTQIESQGRGLNLCLQVVDGILAHNGEILCKEYTPDYSKTWDRFDQEYAKCMQDPSYNNKITPMTLEGCVVRISDIIAYIGRDVEDAIMLHVIDKDEVPAWPKEILGVNNQKIVNTLVMDLIKNSYDTPYLSFSKDVFQALGELKDFNYTHIYSSPKIKSQSAKIKNMFRMLFDQYCLDLENNAKQSPVNAYFLKKMDTVYTGHTDKKRIVVDFIAGMTDDFFNNQFKERFVPRSFGYSFVI